MSVSVFHRFAMSEATRAPRGPPPGLEIERARRVLNFGKDSDENPTTPAGLVAAEELAETMRRKSTQWGFNFERGVPLEGNSRLKWTKVNRNVNKLGLDQLQCLRGSATQEKSKSTTRSRQSSLPEYMAKTKRSSGASSSKSAASDTSAKTSDVSAEAPPKKKQKTST